MDSFLLENHYFLKDNHLNKELIGKLLLKKDFRRTRTKSRIKERKSQELAILENFEQKFQYFRIVKKYRTLLKKKQKIIPKDIKRNNQNILSTNLSQNFLVTKIKNKNSLLSDSPLCPINYKKKITNIYQNSFYDMDIQKKKRIISSSLGREYHNNFNKNNITNDIVIKKRTNLNKIRSQSSLRHYDENLIFPFIKIESTTSDIFKDYTDEFKRDKLFKKLAKKYKFYPASYLEEHKNMEGNKYRFICHNFSNKFSLIGKYDRMTVGVNDVEINDKSDEKYKKIRPSEKIVKHILKIENRNKRKKFI